MATARLIDPDQVARARARLKSRRVQSGLNRIRQALCEPARLQIVEALGVGELCVGDLANVVERAPAATSQHLRVLRELGLVEGLRRGTTIYYRLRPSPEVDHLRAMLDLLERSGATA